MTAEDKRRYARFNELLNGPLSHPLMPFTITRLQLCLASVLQATGAVGWAALEEYCAARDRQDREMAEGR